MTLMLPKTSARNVESFKDEVLTEGYSKKLVLDPSRETCEASVVVRNRPPGASLAVAPAGVKGFRDAGLPREARRKPGVGGQPAPDLSCALQAANYLDEGAGGARTRA